MDYKMLKKLCCSHGVSGYEQETLKIIQELICDFADGIEYDKAGNLVAFKKGSQTTTGKTILYSCHADEVGFVVTHICEDGRLLFEPIGMGVRAYAGRRVLIGNKKIPGIISVKPVHLLSSDERGCDAKADELAIDIGAKNRREAEKLGVFADYAVFDCDFEDFGEGKIKSKALDDRVGCAMLVSLMRRGITHDAYFAFCTGEEIGLRGSAVVAERVKPDICINLECTTAGDVFGAGGAAKTCTLGGGAVVPFMDGASVYAHSIYKKVRALSEKSGIPSQTKTVIAGGTDAGSYTRISGGCPVIGIAVPTRYIHSASCVAAKCDIDASEQLLFAVSDNIYELMKGWDSIK